MKSAACSLVSRPKKTAMAALPPGKIGGGAAATVILT
jgi:hypothetical protein